MPKDTTGWIGLEATKGTDYKWVDGTSYGFKNWATNEGNASNENYVLMKRGAGWQDWAGTAEHLHGYTVEFDTACAAPKVEVVLEAAKDANCDGTEEGAFVTGDSTLADLASTECAIMRTRVTNTGAMEAKGVVMNYLIPENMAYVPSTMTLDGVVKTDTNQDDEAGFDTNFADGRGQIQFLGGDIAVGATSPTGEFRVEVK